MKAPKKRETTDGDRDKYFKGQQENEELICFFRKHWVAVLPHIAFLGLFVLLEVLFVLNFGKINGLVEGNSAIEILYVGVVILATVYMHKIFLRMFAYFLNTVRFTSSRVIEHRKTLFLRDSHEVHDIVKVQDVRKSQDGIIKNIFRYGNLLVTLSSGQASKFFTYVPNVNFHFRCLARIKRDAHLYNRMRTLREQEERGHQPISDSVARERVELEAIETEHAVGKVVDGIIESPVEEASKIAKIDDRVHSSVSYNDLFIPLEDKSLENIVGRDSVV